jgi:predicted porin
MPLVPHAEAVARRSAGPTNKEVFMKRSVFLAAAATVATTSVMAQSTVNVYGRLNVSVERQKTEQTIAVGEGGFETVSSSIWALQNSSSRIGFKGTEDLGGGLKAGFQIEHGFNPDTGASTAGNQFWARQSELFLSGGFGTLRLGNFTSEAYYATADYVSLHNHDTGTSADALYAYVGRNTNKIAYRAPEFVKGLSLEAAVSLKETSTTPPDNSFDLAANYDAGPLHVGFGFEKNGDARQFAVSALYTMGAFTFGGYVQRDRIDPAIGNRTNVRLSGMYTMGASEFHLNFGRAGEFGNIPDSEANQFTVAYNYNLSKRTKVYAFYTALSGDGREIYSPLKNSMAFGVRHNF